jgi:uncharacterized membrane protein YqjE
MAAEAIRARNPAGHAGLFNSVLALVNSFAEFISSRTALFAEESKAALAQLLIVLGCVIAALVFLILGYLFLVLCAVVAIARLAEVSWIWVALGAGALHFALAVAAALIGWSRGKRLPYRELTKELKKDREWLRNLDQTSRPNA